MSLDGIHERKELPEKVAGLLIVFELRGDELEVVELEVISIGSRQPGTRKLERETSVRRVVEVVERDNEGEVLDLGEREVGVDSGRLRVSRKGSLR